MNFLGVGPLELVLLILIALVVLGPEDIVKVSKKMGAWIRKARRSETWENVVKISDEVKKIPQNFMEESGMENIKDDLRKTGNDIKESFVDIEEFNRELNRIKLDINNDIKSNKEKGQGLFEYALILSLVSIVIIIVLTFFGVSLIEIYCYIINGLGFASPYCT